MWLFVEELHRGVGRGVIRALQVTGDGLVPGPVVHGTEHHLSFPRSTAPLTDGSPTVETCAAHNPIMTFITTSAARGGSRNSRRCRHT